MGQKRGRGRTFLFDVERGRMGEDLVNDVEVTIG